MVVREDLHIIEKLRVVLGGGVRSRSALVVLSHIFILNWTYKVTVLERSLTYTTSWSTHTALINCTNFIKCLLKKRTNFVCV